jgi:hypothetical protein
MKYLIILLKGVRQLLTSFIVGFVATCVVMSLIALTQIVILNIVPHSIIFGFCIMGIIFAPLILFLKY